ncbi:hypothetical protein JB92DRAFT_2161777 [Gautieria morchelliformis]|nr:hypothetical protein JB92DRAFT_2161777 [Gautieria morchelliformis]
MPNVSLNVVAAVGLVRRSIFRLPSPFATVSVDGEGILTTEVVRKTLNPQWNSRVNVALNETSVATVEIFDVHKSNLNENVCLGFSRIMARDILSLPVGTTQTLTITLERPVGGQAVQGQVVVQVTNISIPAIHHDPSQPESQRIGSEVINAAQNHLSTTSNTITPLTAGPSSHISVATPTRPLPPPPASRQSNASPAVADPEPSPVLPNRSVDSNPPPWLPHGWEERRTAEGQLYYMDHNTRTTSWHRPPASSTSLHLRGNDNPETSDSAESHPLPAGWERRLDHQGRIYYVDHNTQSTTWDDPRGTAAPAPRVLTHSRSSRNLGPLPSGWQMRMTSTGRFYYLDHNTQKTTWDDPRIPSKPGSNAPQYKHDFRQKVVSLRSYSALQWQPGSCKIRLRRNHLFEDAYREVMRHTPDNLKKKLDIRFDGEIGLDYGGLTRFVNITAH